MWAGGVAGGGRGGVSRSRNPAPALLQKGAARARGVAGEGRVRAHPPRKELGQRLLLVVGILAFLLTLLFIFKQVFSERRKMNGDLSLLRWDD